MATDLERLIVQLSADVRRFEKEMAKARGVSNREFNAIEKRAKQLNRNLNDIGKGFGRNLTAPLSGIAAALSVREVIKYADAWTVAGNKIKAAASVAGRAGRDLSGITDIANETRSGITETADLYAKLLRATKDVAQSEEEVARATVIVNKAFKAGGAAASEQAAGVLQLAQALGSGVLQGDELRSLRENAPLIAQAIADEFKTTISGLKDLGANGELETGRVFKAILKAQPQIEKAFSSTNQTIADSFAKIQNQFIRYIGQSDESLGASQRLIAGLNALADNFDKTADTVVAFASILAAGLLGRSIGGMIARLGLAGVALAKFVTQLRAAQAVARGGLLLSGLAGAAGPLGAAIGVAAAATLYFATSSDKASESGKRYAKVLEDIEAAADGAAESVTETTDKINEKQKFETAEDLATAMEKVEEKTADAVEQFDHLLRSVDRTQVPPEALQQIEKLRDGIADGSVKAEDAKQKLYELANTDYRFEAVAKAFDPILTALDNAIKALGVFQERAASIKFGNIADDPRATGFGQLSEREAQDRQRNDFLRERQTEASRTEFERELDTRTDQILKAAEDAGIALSEAAARIQAKTEIETEKGVRSFEGAIGGFVDRVVGAESGGDTNARNSRSTATGLGQFIESTWLKLFREHFPDRAATMSREMILALRTDAETSRTLIEAYARENAALLQKAGVSVNEAALQLAHFLGPQGAINVLKAAPGTPVADVLSAGAIKANPEILGGGATVDDVRGYAERRAGLNTVLARENEIRQEQRDLIRETMAALAEETAGISAETAMLGASNAERERERVIRETLNELQRQGVTITDEVRAAVVAEADARYGAVAAYDAATEAAERLRQKQEELAAVNDEIGFAFQSSIKGLISDLVQGKSATEALYNAVSRLADRLLDIALDQLFAGVFTGGAAGGGLLGGLLGFSSGGYTGNIAKNKPAGVVHGREFVVNAEATKKNRALLEAINAGMSGYAQGGYVMPRIGGVSAAPASGGVAPNVDARTQIVNTFDAQSFLSQALSSQAGVKTILNVVRAQPGAFKAAMNG